MLHGEAVSIGMVLAGKLSVQLGLLPNAGFERLVNVLRNLELPVEMKNSDQASLIEAMKKDKKREGQNLHMVFLNNIGNALIKTLSFNQLEKLLL
jgi:3-dehydroquinate synthase